MELVKYQKKYFHLSRINSIKQTDKWCHIHTNCETKSNCHLLQHSCPCTIRSYTKMYFFFVHTDTFFGVQMLRLEYFWNLWTVPVLWAMTMECAENSTWGFFSPVTSSSLYILWPQKCCICVSLLVPREKYLPLSLTK